MRSGTTHGGERPATFRDVLSSREYRAIYGASALSWVGDYVARAAITALVYQQTGSIITSAAAFAISYAPWILVGPVLASLAERYPYRTVMVRCDAVRMVFMGLVALPGLPLPVILVLLLASALLTPPFEAARSATLPAILHGDRYVVGIALQSSTAQPAQVVGYLLGGALAGATNPRIALLLNAGTFAVSALLIRFGTRLREPALAPERRTTLLGETADGVRLVFTRPALRAPVLLAFLAAMIAVVPEGHGAAWASQLADEADRGLAQGMIMGAVPLGSILGALIVTRLVAPTARTRLVRLLGIAAPLPLIPAMLDPPLVLVTILAGICGFLVGAIITNSNGQFVQGLPTAYRARAFGVVQGGLQLLQGGAVLATGALAGGGSISVAIGLWSTGGVLIMLFLALTWPSARVFADAATARDVDLEQPAAARANGAEVPAAGRRASVLPTGPSPRPPGHQPHEQPSDRPKQPGQATIEG